MSLLERSGLLGCSHDLGPTSGDLGLGSVAKPLKKKGHLVVPVLHMKAADSLLLSHCIHTDSDLPVSFQALRCSSANPGI